MVGMSSQIRVSTVPSFQMVLYTVFFLALILIFCTIIPTRIHAQSSVSPRGDLSLTIRDVILADPRSASLSSGEIDAMVSKLTAQASAQGITQHDLLWRPTLTHATSPDGVNTPVNSCGATPASLCAINRVFGFNGSDTTLLILLGVLGVLILALVAGYLELQHRNNQRIQV